MKFLSKLLYSLAISSVLTSLFGTAIFITTVHAETNVSHTYDPDPAGTLDLSFDGDGRKINPVGVTNDQATAVAIQVDGKIVVAGSFDNPGYDDFFLVRYNDDGTLDASFDTDGIVTTAFGNDDVARAIAIQADGKIVVVGYTSPDGSEADLVIARYNDDGSLDSGFDTDGKITTNLGSGYDIAIDLAIQSDGKIVVVGSKYIGINNNDIAVIRYNNDGSLDNSFDADGIKTTSIGSGYDFGASVIIQDDNKILVGGGTYNGSNTDFAILRYNPDGSLDSSFDSDGITTRDFGIGSSFERGGSIALQPDGKIIIAGNNDDGYFLLARYNNNGSLDTEFDSDGLVSTMISFGVIRDLALQANGKIIIAGFSDVDNDFTVVRYNSNGSLDTNFDADGKVITDFGSNQDDLGNSVAIQPDGKIVVAGYSYNNGSNYDVAVARYIGDSVITVNTNADTNGVCDATCSLREAITAANVNNNEDTILFAGNYTITLGSQLPAITSPVIITGNGAADTIIQAHEDPNSANYRVFEVEAAGSLTLNSLTVRHGKCYTSCTVLAQNGGGIYNAGNLEINDSMITANTTPVDGGAGLYNDGGTVTITGSTFSYNISYNAAGAIVNANGPMTISNSTIANNSATGNVAGGIYNAGALDIYNSTIAGNTSASSITDGDNIYQFSGSLNLYNTIIANAATHGDCVIGAGTVSATNTLIESTGTQACGLTNGVDGNIIGSDPKLGSLTGSPAYLPLDADSPAISAGDETVCAAPPVNNTSQNGATRPQGADCEIGSFELAAKINVEISAANQGSYILAPGASTRESFVGVNGGPVKLESDYSNIVASERVLYNVNGVNTSFSEMLALPDSQLDNTYWLPWYNNVTLDTQLRLGNVSGTPASVQVFIGGTEMLGSPISLTASGADQSKRISFAGINGGPVQVVSDVDIVVSERVLYNVNGTDTSFSEMLALPDDGLDNTYWLPWYNNVTLDTQLRIGNVSGAPASVQVFIGGTEMVGSPISLTASGAEQSKRISFAGINAGPVQIVSDVDIVVSERVLYNVNGVDTSFSEMLAIPDNQLDNTYWLPWYNNSTLDTQLRVGNVSGAPASVHVFIGGDEMLGSPFNLDASGVNQSKRISFAGINSGPVEILSNVDIVVSERVLYNVNGVDTSFSEMLALPDDLLNATYWIPWYNNVTLDTQLRFGVP